MQKSSSLAYYWNQLGKKAGGVGQGQGCALTPSTHQPSYAGVSVIKNKLCQDDFALVSLFLHGGYPCKGGDLREGITKEWHCQQMPCLEKGVRDSFSSFFIVYSFNILDHRVYRVPGFLSRRLNWVPPSYSPARECCSSPPPLGPGGDTLARGEGVGGPNPYEGTDTLVLYMYLYYIPSTLQTVQIPVEVLLKSFYAYIFAV